MGDQCAEVLDPTNQCWVEAEILDIDLQNAKFTVRYRTRQGPYKYKQTKNRIRHTTN